MRAPLRVGSVPYLVARPLDSGLGDEPGIELVHAVPARLVEALRSGQLDVALVSSIELFRRPGYGYLAGPTVAGRGPVSSVQVFLRRPARELQTLALDPVSRAAATLTRLVLDGSPRFVEVAADEDPREADADAWLRIGDAALRERWAPDAPPTLDPAQRWFERTGLPMPFAVWIVRPGLDVTPWLDAFLAARERGTARRAELAAEAAEAWRVPPDAADRYLTEECRFELGAELAPALRAFRDRAAAHGLCSPLLDPQAITTEVSGVS